MRKKVLNAASWMTEQLCYLMKYFIIFFCFYQFVLQISVVRGHSMEPLLNDGDRLVVDKLTMRWDKVERFEVLVFKYPEDPGKDYVKRLVGFPGEEIELRDGRLYVDRRPMEECYVLNPKRENLAPVRVRRGHYFVLGDNRNNSSDSRAWGAVPRDYFKGRVLARLWPVKSLTIFSCRKSAWILLAVLAAVVFYLVWDTPVRRPALIR